MASDRELVKIELPAPAGWKKLVCLSFALQKIVALVFSYWIDGILCPIGNHRPGIILTCTHPCMISPFLSCCFNLHL